MGRVPQHMATAWQSEPVIAAFVAFEDNGLNVEPCSFFFLKVTEFMILKECSIDAFSKNVQNACNFYCGMTLRTSSPFF